MPSLNLQDKKPTGKPITIVCQDNACMCDGSQFADIKMFPIHLGDGNKSHVTDDPQLAFISEGT